MVIHAGGEFRKLESPQTSWLFHGLPPIALGSSNGETEDRLVGPASLNRLDFLGRATRATEINERGLSDLWEDSERAFQGVNKIAVEAEDQPFEAMRSLVSRTRWTDYTRDSIWRVYPGDGRSFRVRILAGR